MIHALFSGVITFFIAVAVGSYTRTTASVMLSGPPASSAASIVISRQDPSTGFTVNITPAQRASTSRCTITAMPAGEITSPLR